MGLDRPGTNVAVLKNPGAALARFTYSNVHHGAGQGVRANHLVGKSARNATPTVLRTNTDDRVAIPMLASIGFAHGRRGSNSTL